MLCYTLVVIWQLWLAATAYCAVIQVRQSSDNPIDNSGFCLAKTEPTIPEAKGQCGTQGTIKPERDSKYYTVPAFDRHECEQRCFYLGCYGFSIRPSADNVHPGECTLYKENPYTMKFKKSMSGVHFYSTLCFNYTLIDDTPIADGTFSESGRGDFWRATELYGAGKFPVSPQSEYQYTHNRYYGTSNYVARLYGFDYYSSSPSAEPTGRSITSRSQGASYRGGIISQRFPTCPYSVYSLSYEEGDLSWRGDPVFYIYINDVQVLKKTESDGKLALRPAIYFRPTTSHFCKVKFVIPADTHDAYDYWGESEVFDNVVVQTVFRGELPVGTEVFDVD